MASVWGNVHDICEVMVTSSNEQFILVNFSQFTQGKNASKYEIQKFWQEHDEGSE